MLRRGYGDREDDLPEDHDRLSADERRETGSTMVSVFSALGYIREHGITPASAQAVLAIAMQTSQDVSPRVATPSAVAERLGMSLSAVSRLLAKLVEQGGPELLASDSTLLPGRSEAYVLTDRGREFVSRLLAAHDGQPSSSIRTHTIESYNQAVWAERRTGGMLRQTSWNDESLVLTVQPAAAAGSEDLRTWIEQHLTPGTTIERERENARITFKRPNDAVWFKLRWC